MVRKGGGLFSENTLSLKYIVLTIYPKSAHPWNRAFGKVFRRKSQKLDNHKTLRKSVNNGSIYQGVAHNLGWVPNFPVGEVAEIRVKWNGVGDGWDLGVARTYKNLKSGNIWDEWGRHASEWAETLGKWSHGLQEGFEMAPGLVGGHIKFKNGWQSPKI